VIYITMLKARNHAVVFRLPLSQITQSENSRSRKQPYKDKCKSIDKLGSRRSTHRINSITKVGSTGAVGSTNRAGLMIKQEQCN
jgi:hypothetical protein